MTAITFASENSKGVCPGVLHDTARNKSIGVIVLQEWWGMNDGIVTRAKEIGEKGNFITLVPDLYRGVVAIDREKAGHLMNNLDWKGAVLDIQGAARFLMSRRCKRIGVMGFCMGGALSLASAALVPEISAAVPFYGIPKPELCDLETIRIPVQAHFGTLDTLKGFSSLEDAKALEKKLTGKCDFELFLYPKGHAFNNPASENYSEEASILSLWRATTFLNKILSPTQL